MPSTPSLSHRGLSLATLLFFPPLLMTCEGGGTGPGKATIGADGGFASLEKGAVTLWIPSGALSTDVEFTADQDSSGPESDLVVPGSTYDIGPTETAFEKLITVTLSYDPENLPEGVREAELRLFWAAGSRWQLVVDATVDTDAHTVSGRVTRLGLFCARGLSVASVEVTPSSYSLEQGQTKGFMAAGLSASGFSLPERTTDWTSSDESVATVDADGLVTAVGVGSDTITATMEGRSGSATVSTWNCSPQSSIPAAECQAIVDLFDALNEQDWRYSNAWAPTPDPCDWLGVTCAGGSVSELTLPGGQRTGSIPFSLGDLANLTKLDLSGNRLSGAIPYSLGNLSFLRSLNLSSNDLSGPIPSEFANLTNLTELILYWNELSGLIPSGLGDLPELTDLRLNGNHLSGQIPWELGNLANLLDLNLLDNQLSGSIPSELGSLPNIEKLSVSVNQLSGRIPPELGSLSTLSQLGLSGNQLTGQIPSELGNLSNLQYLFFHQNQLSGIVPLEVARVGGLIQALDGGADQCTFVPQGAVGLSIPDTQEYRAADLNGDGIICGLVIGAG